MSAFLFLSAGYVPTLAAGILVYLSHVLDCVDGEIARAKNLESSSGALLDYFLDRLADIAIYSGVTFGLFLSRNDPAVLALGIFVVGSNFFMTDVGQRIDKLKREKHIRRKPDIYKYFYYGGSANTIVVLAASIVGRLYEGMAIIGILSFSFAITRFAEAYIALGAQQN
jgi:phosphatidylglycerophosphate synthase